ncbi:MAG: replicative helicase [Bacillota bacterium]|jgi:replicative DNA helicase|nr:replicative helicase [Bacillota bacterium]MDK2882107.1 replicative helicase [Bacillota bacterium]MDK2924644.1 replicative helicase [Bacillota bacterium]
MAANVERVPPYSLEAEQSVLGAMLLDAEAVYTAAEILRPEDFYQENHQHIFRIMTELSSRGVSCDLVTVSEALRQEGRLEAVGGIAYLSDLAASVPSTANAEHYARIVAEKSLLRQLIRAANKIIEESYSAAEEAAAILDDAERAILNVAQRRSGQELVHVREALVEAYDRIEYLAQNQGVVPGLSTGFRDLDRLTSGLQPADFIVVAARPSMGKTSFCLNIAQHVAAVEKRPVALFSLEMSREQLVQRLLAAEARIPGQKLRTGALDEEDWPRLVAAMGRLAELPIFIDDSPAMTVMEIRAKARRLVAEQGPGLIIIDYLQLIQGTGRSENRQQEISEISRSLKALAREVKSPVVALSQLSRAVEQRQDKRPVLSDLRESGAIEQDADLVAFIYRDEYYNPDTEKKGIAEVIISKQRNGPTGVVQLAFLKDFTLFHNLSLEVAP